jgi:hypothetical protein
LPSLHELSLVELPSGGDNAGFEVARAWTRARAGAPRAAWLLDAVAAASAPDWYGTSSLTWLAHLWTGRLIPDIESLIRDGDELSEHVRGPLRGALLDCCEEQQGPNYAALAWSLEPARVALPNDTEFRRWLEQRLSSGIERSQAERDLRRQQALERAERRGVCLVPSLAQGAEFEAGFGSADCARTLEELHEMGANSVAFSWCSALEPSAPREFGRAPATWTQAQDGALYWAMARARGLGLGVVLLPQLLATEHGGWAGQVLLNTQANQALLFGGWDRFLQHVGLCAQLFGVDVLSIGAEAPDASFTREVPANQRSWEQLPLQREQLSRLIDSARRAFGGGLTYVSRWDGETSGIEFWHQLDFLSQNVFAPYGDRRSGWEPASAQFGQQLVADFKRISNLAEEQNVRALVLGVGLSSSALAWGEPWRTRGELDLEVQKQFYLGLLRSFQLGSEHSPWPAGIYAWCWWTDPAAGGMQDRGFTPQNKPAEVVLRRALRVQ